MPHAYETELAADYPLGHRDFTGVVHHLKRQAIGYRPRLACPCQLCGGGHCGGHQCVGFVRIQTQFKPEHQPQHA